MQRRTFLKAAIAAQIAASPYRGAAAEPQEPHYPEESISDFSKSLRPLGRILELEGYYVWCNTPIQDELGKTHVFYSRWPEKRGMGGWLNACEIAHAVAENPAGPYETVDVVLAPRPGHWDSTTCHNPHIQKADDQYCLFYLGNSNGKTNTKRVGLAISDSLDGPWRRSERPLLEPGAEGQWDDHCTTNPSFIKLPDGQCRLYYKSWNTADYLSGKPPVRGNRKYGLAVASDLQGPYTKHPDNPLVDFSSLGNNRQCEDAYIWREDGVFKMIARDMGVFDHNVGLIMESRDGVSWTEPQIAYFGLDRYLTQPPAPRRLRRYGRLERPQLLFQDGRPTHLFGASQGGRHMTASGVVFAIDPAEE